MDLITETVAMIEISDYEANNTLKGMPTMVTSYVVCFRISLLKRVWMLFFLSWIERWLELFIYIFLLFRKSDSIDGTYILPPIRYPDGNWYLKIGHSQSFEEKIEHDEEALKSWYNSGGFKEATSSLAKFLSTCLIPDLEVLSVKSNCCITTRVYLKLITMSNNLRRLVINITIWFSNPGINFPFLL